VKLPLAGRVAGLVLAGLTTATVLAACGGGSSSTATPSANASGGAAGASGIQAYVSCLSQHGVTLPTRAPGARGTRSPGTRPSFSRGPRPSGSAGAGRFGGGGFGGGFGGGGFGGGLFNDPSNPPTGVSASTWSAALTACKSLQPTVTGNGGFNSSQFTAYRNCLQSHGVTFSAGPNGLSTSDSKVAAALKTCAPLRPTGGARSSGAPTPAPSATG
jgi:hypothetical protein